MHSEGALGSPQSAFQWVQKLAVMPSSLDAWSCSFNVRVHGRSSPRFCSSACVKSLNEGQFTNHNISLLIFIYKEILIPDTCAVVEC